MNEAASLQARIAAIAEAAGRRNPGGFVDRVAARATAPPVAQENEPFWRLSKNKQSPLEEAVEAGDVSQAQAIVTSARRELRGALLAKRPLAPSEARRLVAAGASVRDADDAEQLATQSDDVIFILALPALEDLPSLGDRPELIASLEIIAEKRGIGRDLLLRKSSPADSKVLALRRLLVHGARVEKRERAMLKALGEWRSKSTSSSSLRWSQEMEKEDIVRCRERIEELQRDLETARTHIAQLEDEIVVASTLSSSEEYKTPVDRKRQSVVDSSRTNDDDSSSLVSRIRGERLADVDMSSLPEHVRVGAVGLRRSLAAATDRLAKDLYDDNQTHFVYELLANADDATFDETTNPTYKIYLDTNTLIFRSSANETGLSEADVEAICDVSRSNKDGKGTTGHKGIGFKSVFSVCDCPRLYSGKDLAIAFDTNKDGQLGLVTPSFASPRQDEENNTTAVELCLRGDNCVAAIRAELEGTFRRDAEYILLFARRLRRLHVAIDEEIISDLERCDKERVSLIGNRSYEMWRENEVVLAFPLDDKDASQEHFAHCVAPVETIPFNFSIQAPFEVVASRNSLRHSSAKNLKLRRDIKDAFLKAVEERPAIASRVNKYLDSSTPSHFFWSELRRDLLDALANIACIPLLGGAMVKPTDCLRFSEATAEGRMLQSLGVASVLSSTSNGESRRCRVVSCDPTDSLSLVVPEFKPSHLVSWLLEKQQQGAELPSTMDEKTFFKVLLETEPVDWQTLRQLKIVPTSAAGTRVALDDGLLALSIDVLEPLSAARLAELGMFSITDEFARPFVLRHGGLESLTLAAAYDHVILRISSSISDNDDESLTEDEAWTALEIARRRGRPDCVFKIPDQAGVLRIPDALVSPLFLGGAASILPNDVTDHLDHLLFGTSRRRVRPPNQTVASIPPATTSPELLMIEWEAFFDQLGVRRRPAGSVAAEALVSAGAALSSVEFWRHISPEAIEYLNDRLDSDPDVRAVARKLPVNASGTTLDELFARDVYAPIAGDALPYAFGAVENFPELGTIGFSRRRAVLAKLINATFEPECVLNAAKILSAKSSSLDAFAKLYAKCENLAKLADSDWIAIGSGKGLASIDRCVWNDDPVLLEAAGSVRLASLYPSHLQRRFEDAGVQRSLGSATDCLAILRTIAQTDYSNIFTVENFHSAAWDAALLALRRLVDCTDETARDATRNAFVAHRLVLVPRSPGGHLIALGLGEAFWDASPPAASFALSRHYPQSFKSFFVDFLSIQDFLQSSVAVLNHGVRNHGGSDYRGAQQGLSHEDLAPPPRRQPVSERNEIVARAIYITTNAFGELPAQIGTVLSHPSNYVAAAADAFAIPRRSLAVSTRQSCSFTFDGFLVLSELAAYSEDLAFIVSEFAYGLAHNISSSHDEQHGIAVQALLAFVLPRIAQHFSPAPYFQAPWQQQQLRRQNHPSRGRAYRGRGRGRGQYEGPTYQYF